MLALEDFRDTSWAFHRPNGDFRSPCIRLDPSGALLGYHHPNETSWDIEDGKLVFRDATGKVTARSGEVTAKPDGSRAIVMMRADNHAAPAHLLYERDPIADLSRLTSWEAILVYVQTHRAFDGDCRLGKPGFSAPAIRELEVLEVTSATLPRLAELGINVPGPFGAGNTIIFDKTMPKINLSLRFNGCGFNSVLLDPRCRLSGTLMFDGNENVAIFGAGGQHGVNVSATFRYHAAGLLFGAEGTAGHVNIWVEGPGRSVQTGDDFLFSWGIWLRTADSHGIVDLESGKIVNPSRSIIIGPHVWLGQDVIVMPGARIGGGSIIGARSVVTKPIPPGCVAAGAPACLVRRHASWTRQPHPDAQQIAGLQSQTFLDP